MKYPESSIPKAFTAIQKGISIVLTEMDRKPFLFNIILKIFLFLNFRIFKHCFKRYLLIMKNLILSVFTVLFAISCEKKSTETQLATTPSDSVTVPETNEPVQSSTLQTCFMGNTEKDSIFMTLDDNLGTFTGKLRYKNFEKDSSFGDIVGNQNGDTLKLNYTFQSEGMTSEREIFYLKKDGNLIEGIGDHKTTGNKEVYANYSKIRYEGQVLKQEDCNVLDKKIKEK